MTNLSRYGIESGSVPLPSETWKPVDDRKYAFKGDADEMAAALGSEFQINRLKKKVRVREIENGDFWIVEVMG